MAKEIYVWREYAAGPPFTRYAFTSVEDLTVPDGYRITHHDVQVSDLTFMHGFHTHMMQPHPINVDTGDTPYDVNVVKIAHAGEPGHFAEAIRTFSAGAVRPWKEDPA